MNKKQEFSYYFRQNGLEITPDEADDVMEAMAKALLPVMRKDGLPVPDDDDKEEMEQWIKEIKKQLPVPQSQR